MICAPAAFSCSAFLVSAGSEAIVGRNLDWDFGHGLVIVNQRGLEKKALIGSPNKPAQWVSKYGSVTFNQVGRELPYGGVNERGLDVEQLWLRSAKFPAPNAQPAVNEMQWIQYQLDNFSTVREVLANLGKTNVVNRIATVHYFVCDASGECATIEPINGRLEVHAGKSLPVPALTNDAYSDSIRYAEPFLTSKGAPNLPQGTKSLARFARLSRSLKNGVDPARDPIEAAFARLSGVSSARSNEDDDATRWSIVSDLKRGIVYFKTSRNPAGRSVNLSKFDFSCGAPARVLDIDFPVAGDVSSRFVEYRTTLNSGLVNKSLATGFAHLPPELIQKIANYPDSALCKDPAPKTPFQ